MSRLWPLLVGSLLLSAALAEVAAAEEPEFDGDGFMDDAASGTRVTGGGEIGSIGDAEYERMVRENEEAGLLSQRHADDGHGGEVGVVSDDDGTRVTGGGEIGSIGDAEYERMVRENEEAGLLSQRHADDGHGGEVGVVPPGGASAPNPRLQKLYDEVHGLPDLVDPAAEAEEAAEMAEFIREAVADTPPPPLRVAADGELSLEEIAQLRLDDEEARAAVRALNVRQREAEVAARQKLIDDHLSALQLRRAADAGSAPAAAVPPPGGGVRPRPGQPRRSVGVAADRAERRARQQQITERMRRAARDELRH